MTPEPSEEELAWHGLLCWITQTPRVVWLARFVSDEAARLLSDFEHERSGVGR